METDQTMMIRTPAEYSVNREPDILYYEDEVPFDFTDFTNVLSGMMFFFSLTGDNQGRFF